MIERPTICVCGAGTMGSGIAQVFAQHGYHTTLYDVNEAVLQKARERISKYAPSHLHRISFTSRISDCKAHLVLEAIIEDASAKVSLINQLISMNGDHTVYATNTSSLSVNALADAIDAPQNFVGMHFFNPAPVMKLVEVVRTPHTSERTINFVMSLTAGIEKTPVLCKDSPGFIVNRVARPYYLEALYLLEKYNVSPASLDQLLEDSGFRMGPFQLMDMIGNDINYAVSCIIHEAMGHPDRLKPSPLQQQKVTEGSLGRKTGKGYYEYPGT